VAKVAYTNEPSPSSSQRFFSSTKNGKPLSTSSHESSSFDLPTTSGQCPIQFFSSGRGEKPFLEEGGANA